MVSRRVSSLSSKVPVPAFTPAERALIRHEFGMHFGAYPSVTEGIFLRSWRGGPQAGQPKLPPAIKTMVERGLVEVRITQPWARAFFTEAGLGALRELVMNPRYLDPKRYGHIGRELATMQADATAAGAIKETDSSI